MWTKGWRQTIFEHIDRLWDVVIIGAGITGAGIMREAVRAGLRTLLLDAADFSAGTSSHSSKLVHGGFRYLKNGQIKLVIQSVRERERLLKECQGIIKPLDFVITCYRKDKIPSPLIHFGLGVYDLLAGKWEHRHLSTHDINLVCPSISERDLIGAYQYRDAITDDSRLVLRLIRESVKNGGIALNYTQVADLLFNRNGIVSGVAVKDLSPDGNGKTYEVQSQVVINATGAWADNLRVKTGKRPALRKLRGSHLVFPSHKFPLNCAVSLFHPRDGRPVFAIPWEGITFIGTTDVDHESDNLYDVMISHQEVEYLLEAVDHSFSELQLSHADIQSTFSGIRAVLNTGKKESWKEPRKHLLWLDKGLVTITSGKLTTFRLMAHETLKLVIRQFDQKPTIDTKQSVLHPFSPLEHIFSRLPKIDVQRLLGRYGCETNDLIANASENEWQPVEGSSAYWAELRWAAQNEGIVHLDDLLLRRIRVGLQLPQGGISILDRLRPIVQNELVWDDDRWVKESQRYINKWNQSYRPPPENI
jgi:glycerol-3-phosphate dehydrogenase